MTAVFGTAIGCSTSNGPNLRTPMPEQYALPPADDARFTQPVSYPKDVLNQEPVKAAAPGGSKLPSQQNQIAPSGNMGRAGATPGGF
jgi:hypothetical protein